MARVVPDVVGLHRTFDYLIPEHLRENVRVGTIVRIPLHGRKLRGWVVGVGGPPETDRPLLPLTKVSGLGPPADLVALARWAAWRWAGHPTHFLSTASPPRAVLGLPQAGVSPVASEANPPPLVAEALQRPLAVVRVPPAGDVYPFLGAAAGRGNTLVLVPGLAQAAELAQRLRSDGREVALMPRDWARAAAGGCLVIGARAAAWAPVPDLQAVVVLDEHDESYQEERTPTWNARDVVIERARRAHVPCVLVSPVPSLEALSQGPLLTTSRAEERNGWPVVEVVDRRPEPPGSGLYSSRLVQLVRGAEPGRPVLCVLNRKGRVRLLACAACGELARCEVCDGPMESADLGLRCRRCSAERPVVCPSCGATRMKALRVGVTRAREELEALAGRSVEEVTADNAVGALTGAHVLVGTEAVLHRVRAAAAVAFLDFDQELLAARYRSAEEAFGLLARAARIVGGRTGGKLLVQTRLPTHEAIDAAVHADPARLAVVEAARRAALRFPPETALARVSGQGGAELIEALAQQPGLEVLGPSGPLSGQLGPSGPLSGQLSPASERWLVRAADHATLCDGLAAAGRPRGRVRVEVDPLRA